eukprot:1780781-Ditylum_brightwellii.AAC.1
MPCVDCTRKTVMRVMRRITYQIRISWPLMKVVTQMRQQTIESLKATDWLGIIKVLRNIVSRPSVTPSKPKFDFNIDKDVAWKNSAILKNYKYYMIQAIAENKGSTMWYGSEFRPLTS